MPNQNGNFINTNTKLSHAAGQSAFLFALALILCLATSSLTLVRNDELYHLLAAQSWQVNGSYQILDGEYMRGAPYTVLAGFIFRVFSIADVFMARIPAIVFGAMLIGLVFFWLKTICDAKAAWAGALLLCFSHFSITVFQFARFYSLHALLIWIASVAVYIALGQKRARKRLGLLLAAAIFLIIAFLLQVTTAIALAALLLWLAIDIALKPAVRELLKSKKPWLWIAGFVLMVFVAAYFAAGFFNLAAKLDKLASQFRYAPLWAYETRDNLGYYYRYFRDVMPLLWNLLPVAFMLAVTRWPRTAIFCLVMFMVPLIVHSFGAMKSPRYIYYVFPYFFAIWGMAASTVIPALQKAAEMGLETLKSYFTISLSGKFQKSLAAAIVIASVGLGLIANPTYLDTARLIKQSAKAIVHDKSSIFAAPPDLPWTNQADALRQIVGKPSVLVTADDLRAIHYLGGYHFLLNASILSDVITWQDFEKDFRTGRPLMASAKAMERVINCYADGVILVPESRWRFPPGVNSETADVIERLATPLPPLDGFRLFKWNTPTLADDCLAFQQEMRGKVDEQYVVR